MNEALYENEIFRSVAGKSWHPGGLELTLYLLHRGDLSPGAKVADVGCGAGESSRLLSRKGFEVFPIDLHSGGEGIFPNALPGRAEHLPLGNASMDAVLCECVLSLVPNKALALGEFFRVLKQGGCLLMSDLVLKESHEQGASTGGCMAGAIPVPHMESLLIDQGFFLDYTSDESRALKALGAQLLWQGLTCVCGVRNFAYRIWVARKKELFEDLPHNLL